MECMHCGQKLYGEDTKYNLCGECIAIQRSKAQDIGYGEYNE